MSDLGTLGYVLFSFVLIPRTSTGQAPLTKDQGYEFLVGSLRFR